MVSFSSCVHREAFHEAELGMPDLPANPELPPARKGRKGGGGIIDVHRHTHVCAGVDAIMTRPGVQNGKGLYFVR